MKRNENWSDPFSTCMIMGGRAHGFLSGNLIGFSNPPLFLCLGGFPNWNNAIQSTGDSLVQEEVGWEIKTKSSYHPYVGTTILPIQKFFSKKCRIM